MQKKESPILYEDILALLEKEQEVFNKDISFFHTLDLWIESWDTKNVNETLTHSNTMQDNERGAEWEIWNDTFHQIIIDTNTIEEHTQNDETQSPEKKIFTLSFLIKYFALSACIFIILFVSFNFHAYKQRAISYFYSENIEKIRHSMLASVQLSNKHIQGNMIANTANPTNNSTKRNENTTSSNLSKEHTEISASLHEVGQKEIEKNKTFHSMEKLVKSGKEERIVITIPIVPYENRIVIPKIGKNIPLVEIKNKKVKNVKELEDIFMEELVNGVVRYPWTAKPWKEGNAFIFWHSSNFPWIKGEYNDVFALLDKLVYWDEIIVYYEQQKFVYTVKEKKVIKPWDVSLIKDQENNKKKITLMTCWPIGTTLKRLVVIGEIVPPKK